MSQYRISKESGIPQPTLSRISAGQPDCMASTISKLAAVCRSKGIDPEQLGEPKSAA